MPRLLRRETSAARDGPFAVDPLADRLSEHQRQQLVIHFQACPRQRFRHEVYVFLSRECRLRPQHRDYRGIADVQAVARQRGLLLFFDEAQDKVDVEIWGSDPAPTEARELAAWESAEPGHRRLADMLAPVREYARDGDPGDAAHGNGRQRVNGTACR